MSRNHAILIISEYNLAIYTCETQYIHILSNTQNIIGELNTTIKTLSIIKKGV